MQNHVLQKLVTMTIGCLQSKTLVIMRESWELETFISNNPHNLPCALIFLP